jgi:nucleotide-binding universal stress UspA family protein
MDIRTILTPLDFSGCSLAVVREVASLAAKLDARVVLLHVAALPAGVPAQAHVWPDGREVAASDFLVAESRERMERFAAEARRGGVSVDVTVRVGPITPTILAAIDELGADLVVMGTHGRTGLARLVLGSVAEGVAHRARVPVLLIRREPRPDCGRATCEWCAEADRSPAEQRIEAETQG